MQIHHFKTNGLCADAKATSQLLINSGLLLGGDVQNLQIDVLFIVMIFIETKTTHSLSECGGHDVFQVIVFSYIEWPKPS